MLLPEVNHQPSQRIRALWGMNIISQSGVSNPIKVRKDPNPKLLRSRKSYHTPAPFRKQ
jgi:hypothetical protein